MNYKTHNQDDLININGTHLQGRAITDFFTIRNTFGEPMRYDGMDKVQVEWAIQFDDGQVATIYDWKEYTTPAEMVTDWHIGGNDYSVVDRVKAILREATA